MIDSVIYKFMRSTTKASGVRWLARSMTAFNVQAAEATADPRPTANIILSFAFASKLMHITWYLLSLCYVTRTQYSIL
jgi:hypothetical protein